MLRPQRRHHRSILQLLHSMTHRRGWKRPQPCALLNITVHCLRIRSVVDFCRNLLLHSCCYYCCYCCQLRFARALTKRERVEVVGGCMQPAQSLSTPTMKASSSWSKFCDFHFGSRCAEQCAARCSREIWISTELVSTGDPLYCLISIQNSKPSTADQTMMVSLHRQRSFHLDYTPIRYYTLARSCLPTPS